MSMLVVTGATGFVGRHLLSKAGSEGVSVLPVVRSREKGELLHQENFLLFHELTGKKLRDLGFAHSSLVHLIGPSDDESECSIWDSIVPPTRAVIAAAEEASIRRIIYLSGFGVTDQSSDIYFRAKAESERLIRSSTIPNTIFRCSYILGPGDELIANLIRDMLHGRVEVPGDGSYRIQPLHVEDVVSVIVRSAEQDASHSSTIDLLNEPVSFREFIGRLASRIRPDAEIVSVPVETFVRRTLFSPNPEFDIHELAILLCDKVGTPTRNCFGVDLAGIDEVITRVVTMA